MPDLFTYFGCLFSLKKYLKAYFIKVLLQHMLNDNVMKPVSAVNQLNSLNTHVLEAGVGLSESMEKCYQGKDRLYT